MGSDTMNFTFILKPFALIASVMQQVVRWLQGMVQTLTSDNSSRMPRAATSNKYWAAGMEQRRQLRIPLQNVTVRVTDGCLSTTAVMDNISPGGVCLSNLPEQLYNHGGALTVYSSNNPGLPVLQIQPRWQSNGWNGKTIGAVILNTTDAWRLFFIHTASQCSD